MISAFTSILFVKACLKLPNNCFFSSSLTRLNLGPYQNPHKLTPIGTASSYSLHLAFGIYCPAAYVPSYDPSETSAGARAINELPNELTALSERYIFDEAFKGLLFWYEPASI